MQTTTIGSTSDVLIVHLKIYQYDWRGSSKIVPKISIDDVIIILGVRYYLKSVIYHAGASIEAGHYFALIRMNIEDEWIVCNDTDIHQHTYGPFRYDYPDPYVLVYERMEVSEASETSPSVPPTKRMKTEDIDSDQTSSHNSTIKPGKSNLINELKYQAKKVTEGLSQRKKLIENLISKKKKSANSNTERQKKYRENLTTERKQEERAKDAERKKKERANYTPEKKQEQLAKDAEMKKKVRAEATEEETLKEKQEAKERMKNTRADYTPEKKQEERIKNAEMKKKVRAAATEEETLK